jgi:hypothetical protein
VKLKAFMIMALLAWQSIVIAEEIETRFGNLATNDHNFLLFEGKLVKPEIQGNNSLSFLKVFKIGNADVVLVQNNGGTGCPALFHLVIVSSVGIQQSPEFGSCSDLVEYKQTGSVLSLSMPKMRGKGKTKYIFENGVLKENGKIVK